MKRRLGLVLLMLLVLGIVFRHPITVGAETTLFIAQVFPQVPVKPLDWITGTPDHRHVVFSSSRGPVLGDLFLPRPLLGGVEPHTEPALIIAQGVKVPPGSMSGFLGLAASLARLGYVVLFPRLRSLARGHAGLEEPDTYIRSFDYLKGMTVVNPHRISFLGISVGSSIALVAAANRQINHEVHGLVWFAGYYNVFTYLVGVATKADALHGHEVRWQPSTGSLGAVQQTRQILKDKGAKSLLRIFHAHTVAGAENVLRQTRRRTIMRMQRYNPAAHIRSYLAPTFILDDTGDMFVPYVESEKLVQALPRSQVRSFLLSNAFQHVMPGPGGLPRLVGGFFGIFGFIYTVLNSL